MNPLRAKDPYDWSALLRLIRTSFAYMDGRIDPPSSMHQLTVETVQRTATDCEIWVIEDQGTPVACVFLTPKDNILYLGKLAVASTHRGRGYARALIAKAEERAADLGLTEVELHTRVELFENHTTFAAMGFLQCDEFTHDGFDHPTSIVFRKKIPA